MSLPCSSSVVIEVGKTATSCRPATVKYSVRMAGVAVTGAGAEALENVRVPSAGAVVVVVGSSGGSGGVVLCTVVWGEEKEVGDTDVGINNGDGCSCGSIMCCCCSTSSFGGAHWCCGGGGCFGSPGTTH
jgi:hypothetical protein